LREAKQTPTLLGLLETVNISHYLVSGAYTAVLYGMDSPVIEVRSFKRPNKVGDSLPSTEDGNRCSFRNVVFFLVMPIAVAARSKARTVFARSNIEIVGSSPA
jgi:hypothetical protein